MVEIICSRSGLKFEAENRRRKVHPDISYYTAHSNTDIRYTAIAVIERGKAEGWDSIEKFEAEIQKALNPEPPVRPAYDFEGAWVARITGTDSKYRFDRKFVDPVDTEGRFKRFNIDASGDGIYECCYKSSKGNETRYYYSVVDGASTEIKFSDVEEMFPEELPASVEGCEKIDGYIGKVGAMVECSGRVFEVVRIDESTRTVEEWDDFEDEYRSWKEPVFTTWVKEVSSDIAAEYLQAKQSEQQAAEVKAQASVEIRKIAKAVTCQNGAIAPKSAPYPRGKEFVLSQGHFQANEILILENDGNRLWSLLYNGRDGDDWSYNNIASSWIGCYLEISDDFKTQVEELLAQC